MLQKLSKINRFSTTKVNTIPEVQQYWDEFSNIYSSQIAPSMQVASVNMLNMMRIQNSKNILEVGIGPGYYVPHLLQHKPINTNLYLTDLSKEILGITKKRIELFLKSPITGPYQELDMNNVPQFEKSHFQEINTFVQQANAEDLQDFQDSSIDTYISSLCLQLTTNPNNQIKECYRVLQPGGRAIFSVWGEQAISMQVRHMALALHQCGIKLPKERNNFHLNDKEKLINMFEAQGFTNVIAWNQFIPQNVIQNPQDIENQIKNPKAVPLMKNITQTEELKQNLEIAIRKILQEEIINKKYPIGLDTLQILVEKPQN